MKTRAFLLSVAIAICAVLQVEEPAQAGTAYAQRVSTLATLQSYNTATMSGTGSYLLDEQTTGSANQSAIYLWESSWSGTPDGVHVIAPSDNPGSCSAGCLVATSVLPIRTNPTYSIASSGGNYTLLSSALTALNNTFVAQNVTVVINIAAGIYNEPAAIVWQSPFGKFFNVKGTTQSATLNSIVSSSGSAGAWSIVLQLASLPSGIATGQYIGINNASGGTLPAYMNGLFKITNVDNVNTRITVTSTSLNASVPSGAVTGSITAFETVLHFSGTDGLDVWSNGSAIQLDKLVVEGDGTASYNGLSIQDGDRLFIASGLGVANFGGSCLYENYNAEVNGSGFLYTSGCKHSALMDTSAAFDAYVAFSGASSDCVVSSRGATFEIEAGSTVTGCGASGLHAQKGGIVAPFSTTSTGNATYGYIMDSSGYVDTTSTSGGNNGSGDYSQIFNFGQSNQFSINSHGVGIGTANPVTTFEVNGAATINTTLNVVGGYKSNGTSGVTCTGTPTTSFASSNGIVTHC